MKKIVSSFLNMLPHSRNVFLSGTLIFGLLQMPFSSVLSPTTKAVTEKASEISAIPRAEAAEISLGEVFFGKAKLASAETQIIEKKMDFVSTRNAFPASLAVIKKHEKTIREKALQNGVPVDVAIGVGLLENGGSETAKSPAGALGVFQLMPGTARALGLTVTSKVDERRNPEKNIEAGMKYLRSNYDRFGDWGLATWAYHAGEGNVTKALQLYAKANHGITLPGVKDPAKHRAYVEKYDIDINKLLSSKAVQSLTKKLNDDSAGYPYKVIATAKLFKESKTKTSVNPGSIVER
jgi:soluble lytic murein transglycosylase-like protein